MQQDQPSTRLENALERAARRYRAERRKQERAALTKHELGALLHRFGAPAGRFAAAVAADDASLIPPSDGAALRAKVEAARQLLRRRARTRDPRYDLNRHMALDRLVRWLDGRRRWERAEGPPSRSCPVRPAAPHPRARPAPSRPAIRRPG